MNRAHIGIDIIEIDRIRQAVDRWGEHFLKRIFTGTEISSYRNQPESLAVRFAGKEAAMKALSPTAGTISWTEVEILSEPNGKPVVRLNGKAQQRAADLGLKGLEISLSHSRENAIALVIGF